MSAIRPRRSRCCGPGADAVTGEPLSLAKVVDTLGSCRESDAPAALAAMLDRMEAEERFALLKLAMGALRIGVSARLAKTALAQGVRARCRCRRGSVARAGAALCRAVRLGRGARRPADRGRMCRCSARSCSRIRSRRLRVDLKDYAAEWKWDGIRVQLVHVAGETRLYSRAGDDITHSFPEVASGVRDARRARRRIAGEGRGAGRRRKRRRRGKLQRAPAAARAQGRDGQDAGRISGVRAALRHIVRRRRGSARAGLDRAAGAAGGVRRRGSTPSGSTVAR